MILAQLPFMDSLSLSSQPWYSIKMTRKGKEAWHVEGSDELLD
jgi:hypothetical protein